MCSKLVSRRSDFAGDNRGISPLTGGRAAPGQLLKAHHGLTRRFSKTAVEVALACWLFWPTWLSAAQEARLGDLSNTLHFDDPSTRLLEQYYAPYPFFKEKGSGELERKTGLVLLNYSTMSDARGERWALIKERNMSGGSIILTGKDVVAVFANGERKSAFAFKQQIGGDQVLSKSVSFGVHRFPIVRVEIR